MKSQILQLKLCVFILLNISVATLQAQPFIRCDTCSYSVRQIKPFDYPIAIQVFPYSDTIAYFPYCHEDSLWKKNVAFIHGLGGSNQSWHKPWYYTDTGFAQPSFRVTYNGWEESFHSAAQQMKADYNIRIVSGADQSYPTRCKNEDYVIAHSQGGIVARYLDYQWWLCENNPSGCSGTFGTRDYYGIVTFATPNMGAHIGLSQNEHKEMIQSIVRAVVINPVTEATYNLTNKWFITPSAASKLYYLNDALDSAIKNLVAPAVLGSLHTPTLNEMLPGSAIMTQLSNYASKVHRVAFYGVEDAPEIWRVLDMVINEEPCDAPLFEANYDETFMHTMETVRDENEVKILINKEEIRKLKFKRFVADRFGPLGGVLYHIIASNNIKKLEAENYHRQKTLDFLNNANTQWRYIIGSYHRDSFDYQTTQKYKVSYKIGTFNLNQTFDNQNSATDFCNLLATYPSVTQVTQSVEVKIYMTRSFFPSDGVVLVKSQKAFPGVLESNTDKMKHNNHFQVRNSSETERVLNNLYKRNVYDQFFRLTKD